MLATFLISLMLAPGPALPELYSRLPSNGLAPPTVGASCKGSAGGLGTGNTFGSTYDTSIINIWVLSDTRRNLQIGWIEKTADGRLWYEDPLGFTRVITKNEELLYLSPDFQFTACFSRDLDLSKLGR